MKLNFSWSAINWLNVQLSIDQFHKKIFYFSKCNNIIKVRILQRMLLRSRKAKLISVYRVFQENKFLPFKGKDYFTKITNFQCFELGLKIFSTDYSSFSRHLIFFDFDTFRTYTLFILTFADRCKEELFKIITVPEWESKFRPSSFGFRPGRGCSDLLNIVRRNLLNSFKYIISFDVSKCFTFLNVSILNYQVNFLGVFKRYLLIWIEFFSFKRKFLNTSWLYFQGRSIFILIFCIGLHGLHFRLNIISEEQIFLNEFMYVFTYFNKFLILHSDLLVILNYKKVVFRYLSKIGLHYLALRLLLDLENKLFFKSRWLFNVSKLVSFDFLGFKYQLIYKLKFPFLKLLSPFRLFVYPSAISVFKHQRRLNSLFINEGKRISQRILIEKLNLIIIANHISFIKFFGLCFKVN